MTLRHRRAPLHALSPDAISLPPTARLLAEGGDVRIEFDPLRAKNQYGSPFLPDADLLAFGSSTASVISEAGFSAADRLRNRLQERLQHVAACDAAVAAEDLYAIELERVRLELTSLCGLAELPGLEIIFATSGTDLHLIAAQLAGSGAARPTLAIMCEAAETGSHVSAALAGRHFGACAAQKSNGNDGGDDTIAGAEAMDVASFAVRLEDGMPRPAAAVDAEVESLVEQAAAQGRRVLLVLVDVSKTGLLAPSPACAVALKRRFPAQLDVMVDASQFRIALSTLRAYLEQDFMVALTGSKFMTGPTFSGALLFPDKIANKLRNHPLPAALSSYSTRAEWPTGWAAADGLERHANFGLLLRWEAALEELRAFCALPESKVARFLDEFAHAICKRLNNHPCFELVPVPQLDRHPLVEASRWDHIQTIFPLLLRRPNGLFLSPAETARVYQQLQEAQPKRHGAAAPPRCQLGQPVTCGKRDGMPVSALRLCASARLVVEAVGLGQGAAVIARALLALDQTAALVTAA